MEIIKRGVNPDLEYWSGTCSHCKSEMKELKKCLKVEYGDIARAKCLVCQHEFILYPPPSNNRHFGTYDFR